MADGCSLVSSTCFVNNRVIECTSADTLKHKECFNLCYDGKRLKWLGSFDSLKNLIKFGIKLYGDWTSPGGSSKKFSCHNPVISITWYPGKQNSLILHGEAGPALSDTLIEAAHAIASQNNHSSKSSLLDESRSPNNVSMSYCVLSNTVESDSVVEVGLESSNLLDKNDSLVSGCAEAINNSLHYKPTQRSYCDCQYTLLAANLEGIKLEIAIMQKDIGANASKSRDDEVNRLKIDLSDERERCERLEADLSFIIEGGTREVNEMNDIIASLEFSVLFGDRLSTSSDDSASDSTVTLALGRDEAFIRCFRA